MKKLLCLALMGALIGAIVIGNRVSDAGISGMFDQDNPAFGTCNNDVPPELKDIKIEQDGEFINVSVRPWVDPWKSEATIASVTVFFSTDGMKSWDKAPAARWVDNEPGTGANPEQGDLWTAELGPFSPGDEVDIRLRALDSEDDMAVEIPPIVTQFPPLDNELFLAAYDTEDAPEGYPKDLDITDLSLGFDDTYLYVRLTVAGKISSATGTLPNLYVIGVIYPDLRRNPITWNHELTDSRMMAYLPRFGKVGFFNGLEGILGGDPVGKTKSRVDGGKLYMAVERSLINRSKELTTADMDREGFKLASGTVMADLASLNTNEGIPDLNAIVKPSDCTGYSIVYFGAHHVTVK